MYDRENARLVGELAGSADFRLELAFGPAWLCWLGDMLTELFSSLDYWRCPCQSFQL